MFGGDPVKKKKKVEKDKKDEKVAKIGNTKKVTNFFEELLKKQKEEPGKEETTKLEKKPAVDIQVGDDVYEVRIMKNGQPCRDDVNKIYEENDKEATSLENFYEEWDERLTEYIDEFNHKQSRLKKRKASSSKKAKKVSSGKKKVKKSTSRSVGKKKSSTKKRKSGSAKKAKKAKK